MSRTGFQKIPGISAMLWRGLWLVLVRVPELIRSGVDLAKIYASKGGWYGG